MGLGVRILSLLQQYPEVDITPNPNWDSMLRWISPHCSQSQPLYPYPYRGNIPKSGKLILNRGTNPIVSDHNSLLTVIQLQIKPTLTTILLVAGMKVC